MRVGGLPVAPRVLATVAVAALVAAGCGSSGSSGSSESKEPVQRNLTVSAAASLTETFTALAHQFEQSHPGVHVKLNFGGSDALAQQIVSGAPVDVFASASTATMNQVVTGGRNHGDPQEFAKNVLEIAVPPANPGRVSGLRDFANAELRLAVCDRAVPCGAAATKIFTREKLNAKPDTFEEDVKSVLTKVELGEVDAGLVYRTDVRSAGSKVKGIDFPEATDAVNDYLIAATSGSAGATAFVDYIRSSAGESALTAAGFQQP